MRNKNYKIIMLGLALQIGVCFGLVFGASNEVLAYTASITTNNNVTVDVSPASGGVSIQAESINVVSDCRNGYNLSIAAPAGSDLYRYDNGTQASTASFTAVDGTSALSSDNNINKWGYTLADNPTGSMVFSPLSATSVALKTSTETASPSSDINDTFNINYGVKVDNSIAPGSYQMANQGAIVYYLTMDTACTQYMVSFNANGGTGTMVDQPLQEDEPDKINPVDFVAPAGASYTDADNNTITGDADKLWLFWGWNTRADGTGDWYKDNEEVLNIASVGSTAILYAQWRQATLSDMTAGTPTGTEKVIGHNLMQDMRPEICYNSDITTAANAPAATLLDYRGKVITDDPSTTEAAEQYTVSKLPDGLCWMTTNLNLGRNDNAGPNNNGTITLTSEDTDLAGNTTFTLPKSTTTSSTTATAARIRTTNTSGNNNNGTYYSWAAAVASTASITDGSPTTSVCPKNWDLPSRSQYSNLASKSSYSSSNSPMNAPSSFLAGKFTNGASFYPSSSNYGFYWSNTSDNPSLAYGARVTTSALTTSTISGVTYGGNKYYEKNVRCVASQGTVTVYYDGNGTAEYPVTGSVAPQENVEINSSSVQSGDGLSRAGWAFTGWNTAPDGSGTTVAVGASFSLGGLKPGETGTLYAQWAPQYTITYANNCMSWASSDANCTAAASATTSEQKIDLNVSGNGSGELEGYKKFTLTGWKIKEWTTNADGTGTAYPVFSTYNVTGAGAGDGITLYAHWVPTYTVQYDGNSSDNDSTGMGSTNTTTGIKTVAHTYVGEGDTFDLFASNFKKAGYGFVGWSTDANAWGKLTDNDTTNDAKIWGPNEIITAPASNGTPITTLYAIWAPAETSGGNPVYLQNWTGCSAMTATTYDSTTGTLAVAKDSVTALTDQRDGEVYTIAKLADGNCWMVENLRLADTHEESGNTVATTLTTSNTNILDSNSTLPITNIYNADSSLATKSNSLSPSSSQNSTDDTSYGWCSAQSATCYNQSRLNTTNTVANITPSQTQDITSAVDFNDTIYAYGNYYNWYSATAGYGTYSKDSGATDGDICPAGWHLPYGDKGTDTKGGNTSGGFYYLASSMTATSNNIANSNKFRAFPNNFIYAGYWSSGSASSRGNYGYYWSASASNSNSAYSLDFNSGNVRPGDLAYSKYNGRSVRCVASPAS